MLTETIYNGWVSCEVWEMQKRTKSEVGTGLCSVPGHDGHEAAVVIGRLKPKPDWLPGGTAPPGLPRPAPCDSGPQPGRLHPQPHVCVCQKLVTLDLPVPVDACVSRVSGGLLIPFGFSPGHGMNYSLVVSKQSPALASSRATSLSSASPFGSQSWQQERTLECSHKTVCAQAMLKAKE
jgi:hypothetical protein